MEHSGPHSAADEPLEVLLVEDNPGDVRLVQEAFETTDHDITVTVVADGDSAVERFCRSEPAESRPALVLLDLNLPGHDGCAVLNAIRGNSDTETLPVLILSSSGADDDVERCYKAQANAYLTKPDTLVELCEMMQAVDEFWFEDAQLPPVSA